MQTVKVYSKAYPELLLAIQEGKVILANPDPTDDSQKWYKDESEFKDEQGYPGFVLINKATSQALKHSVTLSEPVQLTQYNVNLVDGSLLWTQGTDLGDGFGAIRMVNNISFNMRASKADHPNLDGPTIVLSEWKEENDLIWKIDPVPSVELVKVYSKADPNLLLSIRNGKVVLSQADPTDDFQKWYKDEKYGAKYKDTHGVPAFTLINKATSQALKHSVTANNPVQLTPHCPEEVDGSILWTHGIPLQDGFRSIRMLNNIDLNISTVDGNKNPRIAREGEILVMSVWYEGDNQIWKTENY